MSTRTQSTGTLSIIKKSSYCVSDAGIVIKKYSIKSGHKKGYVSFVKIRIDEHGKKNYKVCYKKK